MWKLKWDNDTGRYHNEQLQLVPGWLKNMEVAYGVLDCLWQKYILPTKEEAEEILLLKTF